MERLKDRPPRYELLKDGDPAVGFIWRPPRTMILIIIRPLLIQGHMAGRSPRRFKAAGAARRSAQLRSCTSVAVWNRLGILVACASLS